MKITILAVYNSIKQRKELKNLIYIIIIILCIIIVYNKTIIIDLKKFIETSLNTIFTIEIKINKTLMETIKKEPITPKKVIVDIEDNINSKKVEEVAEVKKLSWKDYMMQIDLQKVLIWAVVIGATIYFFTKGGDPKPPSAAYDITSEIMYERDYTKKKKVIDENISSIEKIIRFILRGFT